MAMCSGRYLMDGNGRNSNIPIDFGDLSWFMVPPQQCDSVWITCLQCHKSCQCFQTEVATIDEVAHEYVVCIGHRTTASEQFFQIIKLSMKSLQDCDNSVGFIETTPKARGFFYLSFKLEFWFTSNVHPNQCYNIHMQLFGNRYSRIP